MMKPISIVQRNLPSPQLSDHSNGSMAVGTNPNVVSHQDRRSRWCADESQCKSELFTMVAQQMLFLVVADIMGNVAGVGNKVGFP